MTLRELFEAHDARQFAEWDRTAALIAAHVNCSIKRWKYNRAHFNPLAAPPEIHPPALDELSELL